MPCATPGQGVTIIELHRDHAGPCRTCRGTRSRRTQGLARSAVSPSPEYGLVGLATTLGYLLSPSCVAELLVDVSHWTGRKRCWYPRQPSDPIQMLHARKASSDPTSSMTAGTPGEAQSA